MSLFSIIVMICCLVPVWGGLIYFLWRLIKLQSSGETDYDDDED